MQDTQEQAETDIESAVMAAVREIINHSSASIVDPELQDEEFNYLYELLIASLRYLLSKRSRF